MNKHLLAIAAIVLVAVAFMPTIAVPVHPPAPAPVSKVAQCLKAASKADKARVAAFYSALADVLERDSAVIHTTGLFRTVHANSLDLAFKGTDLPGKYAGLDQAINDRLVAAIGLENVALTGEKKDALLAALKEVADDAK